MGIPAQLQGIKRIWNHRRRSTWLVEQEAWSIFLFFFFLFFLVSPHSMWVLSYPTRDQTWTPAVKVLHPNHWTTREFPWSIFQIRKRRYKEDKYIGHVILGTSETAGCLPKCVHPFSHSKHIAAGICLPTCGLLLGGRDIAS